MCGLRSEAMQKRLLTEEDLTLTKAVDLAQSMETAERTTKAFKGPEPSIRKIKSPQGGKRLQPCYRCGKTNHTSADCRFKEAECRNCGKTGHIAPVCRSKPKQRPKTEVKPKKQGTNLVQEETTESDSDSEKFYLYKFKEAKSSPIQVSLKVEGIPLTMELDTGAAVSIISEATRKAKLPHIKLRKSKVVLKTYTDEPLQVNGQLNVHVQYGQQTKPLVLVVVAGDGPSLLGRNWLKYIRLNWSQIATVQMKSPNPDLQALLQQHSTLFREELGTVVGRKVTLTVKADTQPKFFKPRPVPFAIKDAVGQELDRLEKQGIITKVNSSDWAAPIVVSVKKDGRLRICGDYKVTINQALDVDQYPLPKPEDLFATLSSGVTFTKLDLSQAYLQLPLEENSKKYATVNTHQGLYQYNRLPFGIASAPAVFQRLMDSILQGIPGVTCYIDDILVTGTSQEDHLRNLGQVLQ